MKQIMSGIEYLHSEDIVHRDIKPGNILVASEFPLLFQLADFDVSKCLEVEVETSLMSSNVGTLAFKAPEFFQRTSPGKIEYHRNVDIYAAGLTFLAILQAKKGKRMLIPHIETPMEDSEYHALSIGQLIAERIKYKVPELNIVSLNGPVRKWKWLISRMTCINPEERLSPAQVLEFLQVFDYVISMVFNLGFHYSYPLLDELSKIYNSILQVKKIKLIRKLTFPVWGSMDVTTNDQLLVRVKDGTKYWIQDLDRQTGDLINEISSMCNDDFVQVKKHPQYADCVLEGCLTCKNIREYKLSTLESLIGYTCPRSFTMLDGPTGSLLLAEDGKSGLCQMDWSNNQSQVVQKFYRGNIPPLNLRLDKAFLRFCYVECYNILLCTLNDKERDK